MTIPKVPGKIKGVGQIAAEAGILLAVLVGAFILGRISILQSTAGDDAIKIVYPPLVNNQIAAYQPSGSSSGGVLGASAAAEGTATSSEPAEWSFAGSKSGKTYYPKGCSGLNRVKPENRVYFTTQEQAEMAGYARSSSC